MYNSKRWQDSSDGWVKSMIESKENKEEYKKYVEKTVEPLTYIKWLKEVKK
tara:strand:+ start:7042 stop:7194 length:153 start_codon:yes stop_codon:yes gene_type:complete